MPDFGKLCQKVETAYVELLISKIKNVKVIYCCSFIGIHMLKFCTVEVA